MGGSAAVTAGETVAILSGKGVDTWSADSGMKVSVCGVITNTVLFSLLFSAVGVGCVVVTASVGAADVDGVVTVLSVVASVRGAAVSVVVVGIDAGVV